MEKVVFQNLWARIVNLFATKAQVQALADAKQDALTAGTGISISAQGVISSGSTVQEVVHIAVTTSVQGVSVSGLTVLAYYNGAAQPSASATTDAQGQASLIIPAGYRYRLTFPSVQGCADIADVTHTATLAERDVEVEYVEPPVDGERLRVVLKKYTPSASSSASGVAVTVAWPANAAAGISAGSAQLTTDSTGTAETVVPVGAVYTVTPGAVEGYATPATQTFTAGQSIRVVTMFYRVYTTGLLLVCTDGTEYTLEDFQAAVTAGTRQNADAVAIKVSNAKLAEKGGVFLIDIDMLASGTRMPANKAWSPNTSYTFTSVPTNGNSSTSSYYYDGLTASRNIQAEGDERSVETPAVDAALGLSLTIDGTPHPGFLGSVGQWAALWPNAFQADDIIAAVRPETTGRLSSKTGNKWTCTQNNAFNAWFWTSSATVSLKGNSSTVVPFFAY